ncbi:MAG TPA: aspartate dehydrogenase [Methanomassiliicoccales archaeon]|nr:aspartate dehydrogenase [Methanomassiliicoccales archaeon]
MRILIIGAGSIGDVLAKAAEDMPEVEEILVADKNEERARSRAKAYAKGRYTPFGEKEIIKAMKEVQLVVEAGSQAAAKQFAPMSLELGRDIMVMSVGAFSDDEFRERCFALARKKGGRLYIPAGAVCGTDGLRSAQGRIDEVKLITTKGPRGFLDNPYLAEKGIDPTKLKVPTVLFEGSARDAVRLFPRNVNVAATVSLLSLGFDTTSVRLVCDPGAEVNSHVIVAKGAFGELRAEIQNVPFPSNPATSYLAALSAVAALKSIATNVWIGV